MDKIKLKKNDPVIVKSGRRADKGKVSKIMRLVPEKKRLVVEKIHLIKEYVRPNPQKNIKGGIVEREGTIPMNMVMYFCKECEQGVRVGYKIADGVKHRVCKKCNTILD
jgi:large subunit ribosomal protein L24